MRSEAMSSSKIEGVIAPAKKILEVEALEELGVSHRVDSSEAAVLANITAMRSSIERIGKGDRISLDLLREINKDLLKGGPLEKAGGVVRTIQNWVGGNDYSPVGAAYVPAPPSEVEPLLEDLVAFCNDAQLPTVAKAAIAHAQFESIHPFADGNGRTGRALVQMIFRNAGAATRTVPPVSLALATDKPAYIAVLSEFRLMTMRRWPRRPNGSSLSSLVRSSHPAVWRRRSSKESPLFRRVGARRCDRVRTRLPTASFGYFPATRW